MEKKWYKNALMLNRDPDWAGFGIDASSKESCIKSLTDYFSIYSGNITDVLLCVFSQASVIPTKAITWRGEKALWKEENGIPVDYSQRFGNLYKCYAEYNVDAVAIFLDVMKKKGIRPWVTLRMNDTHGIDAPTYPARASMYYEELEAGHMLGPKADYFANCYSFKYPRYRNALKQLIGEVLDKYDFFGVELDFMREPYCFDRKSEPDCHKYMTEYIREVRALTREAEKRVGHDIKLMIRIPRAPLDAFEFGFDVKTLCDEGLIDAINPTPHFSPLDSGIPVRQWRELVGDDIGILPGLEEHTLKGTITTVENTKAYIAAFYAEGADGIYLNNYMYPTPDAVATWQLDRNNVYEGKREFLVTYQDCKSRQETRYKPLPLAINGVSELSLNIGKVKKSDKVSVLIDYEGDRAPMLNIANVVCDVPTKAEHHIRQGKPDKVTITEYTPLSYDMSGFETDSTVILKFMGRGVVHFVSVTIES